MATTVEVKILIRGKPLSSFTSLSIRQDILTQHTFEVVCRPDTFEKFASFGESFVIDKTKDLIGEKIKVEVTPLGKDNVKAKSTIIFNGIILEVQGEKYRDAVSGSIMLRGASMDALMDGDRHCRSFENTTLDTIVHVVTNDYSSNLFDKMLVASKHKETIEYVVQYNESNLDFLARLAKTYGEWMLVTGENHFYFGTPPGTRTSLLHGKDLHEFSFSMKLASLGFSFTDYNYYTEESIRKDSKSVQPQVDSYLSDAISGSDGLFTQKEDIHFNHPLSKPNAEKELEAAVKTDKLARIAGLNSTSGSSDNCELALGGIVKIESFSSVDNNKKLNYGEYRIISLHHSCDEAGNYLNHFEAVPLSAEVPPQSNPKLYPFCESQSALVTDNNDPEGMGRIRVRFFWQNKEQSPWLRLISPCAGGGKGFYFIPEIGEEVLIGFENNNAEKPFVFGTQYNGKTNAKSFNSSKNDLKVIQTRSGHVIKLDDKDGSESITITDKNGNIITLNTKDKTISISAPEKIELSAKEIIINGDNKVEIKSKNEVKVSGDNKVSLDSSNSIEENATSIKINAKAKATLSSDLSVSLEGTKVNINGSISTTVKGGILNLN